MWCGNFEVESREKEKIEQQQQLRLKSLFSLLGLLEGTTEWMLPNWHTVVLWFFFSLFPVVNAHSISSDTCWFRDVVRTRSSLPERIVWPVECYPFSYFCLSDLVMVVFTSSMVRLCTEVLERHCWWTWIHWGLCIPCETFFVWVLRILVAYSYLCCCTYEGDGVYSFCWTVFKWKGMFFVTCFWCYFSMYVFFFFDGVTVLVMAEWKLLGVLVRLGIVSFEEVFSSRPSI